MTLYIVKMDDPKDDEIVGLFNANSIGELFWFVDEVVSPYDTVYAELPTGGLVWRGHWRVMENDE